MQTIQILIPSTNVGAQQGPSALLLLLCDWEGATLWPPRQRKRLTDGTASQQRGRGWERENGHQKYQMGEAGNGHHKEAQWNESKKNSTFCQTDATYTFCSQVGAARGKYMYKR